MSTKRELIATLNSALSLATALPDDTGSMQEPTPLPEPVPVPPPPVASPNVKPMLVRSVALSKEATGYLDRLKRCAQLKPGGTRESGNLDGLSKSGHLVDIGRNLALGVVPVLTALRYTGDVDLLYSVHRIMTNLRATLKENTGDGFRGWTGYFLDDKLQNSDRVALEELLSWALVAQMTYAMRLNRDKDPKFAAADMFYTELLFGDKGFVAKWKKRSGRAEPPYVTKPLFHPFVASIRMSYYFWKLTGDDTWRRELHRQVAMLHKELLKVEDRYAWSHWVNHLRKTPVFPLQHCNYSGETLASVADLGFEGVLDNATMQRFANTVTWMIEAKTPARPNFIKGANGETGMAYSELLGREVQVKPMVYGRCDEFWVRRRDPGLLSAWDETGEIEGVCIEHDNGEWAAPIVGALVAS